MGARNCNDWGFDEWARVVRDIETAASRAPCTLDPPPLTEAAPGSSSIARRRNRLRARYGDCCHWEQFGLCKFPGEPMLFEGKTSNKRFATVEHLLRRADGGKTNASNLRLAHGACNHERHDTPCPDKVTRKRCKKIIRWMVVGVPAHLAARLPVGFSR